MDSNGYVSVGGSDDASDISFEPQTFPDPTHPNGVLAAYWTDLDGGGAVGIRVGTLTDGVDTWIVVQWNTHVYGDSSPAGARSMQVWIGTSGRMPRRVRVSPSAPRTSPAPGEPRSSVRLPAATW